jgi:hypothetical protein
VKPISTAKGVALRGSDRKLKVRGTSDDPAVGGTHLREGNEFAAASTDAGPSVLLIVPGIGILPQGRLPEAIMAKRFPR